MALLGALGAVLGAAGGEPLFRDASGARPAPARRSVCLVFDESESMQKSTAEGLSQLEALRRAAHGFLARPELQTDALALVGFADEARLLTPPAPPGTARDALAELRARGRTDLARALDLAREVLASAPDDERWILLFTDGKPQTGRPADPVEEARRAARACLEAGVRIVAVGTGLADRALLAELAGDPENVFVSAPERLGEAFERSGERIANRQMLASIPAAVELEASLKRACGWAALVAFGTGLALVIGHERHLRRRRVRGVQVLLVALGAAASGLVAGAAGQGTFYALSGLAALEPVLRTAAWLLLGSGVVLGMSFFVPNLPHGRALLAGGLGGAAAAASFLRIVPALGDAPGRLLGAAILGCMAGALTVLVEASVRKAWLVVRWPGDETSTLLLGATPVVVGHSARAHICPSFDERKEPVLGSFTFEDGLIRFDDRRAGRVRRLRAGERLSFDPVVVEVHAEARAAGPDAGAGAAAPAGEDEARGRPAPPAALPRGAPRSPARPRRASPGPGPRP